MYAIFFCLELPKIIFCFQILKLQSLSQHNTWLSLKLHKISCRIGNFAPNTNQFVPFLLEKGLS